MLSSDSQEPPQYNVNKSRHEVLGKASMAQRTQHQVPPPPARAPQSLSSTTSTSYQSLTNIKPSTDPTVHPASSCVVLYSPPTLSYSIALGNQVRFEEQCGTWMAHVTDIWGRVQKLPVVCAPDQTPQRAIEALASMALGQHKYCIHILETDQAPWAPRVVRVGALGLRGGGQQASTLAKVAKVADKVAKVADKVSEVVADKVAKVADKVAKVAEVVDKVSKLVSPEGRFCWGVATSPATAIIYVFYKDKIPRLPCRVAVLPPRDEDDLPESQVDNPCKAAGQWVTFYNDGGYWWAKTSRGRIPVKADHNASLSLEDLVHSRFSIRKFRDKSFAGYLEYTFADYDNYTGLGYELELLTIPEQIQSNKEARRRQRHEARRQEAERKRQEEVRRQEAERKRQEAQKTEEAVLRRAAEEQKRADIRRIAEEAAQKEAKERKRQEAQKREETVLLRAAEENRKADLLRMEEAKRKEAAQKEAKKREEREQRQQKEEAELQQVPTQKLAKMLTQDRATIFSDRHEVIEDGYLSDNELDHDLGNNTGSGFDFGTADDHLPFNNNNQHGVDFSISSLGPILEGRVSQNVMVARGTHGNEGEVMRFAADSSNSQAEENNTTNTVGDHKENTEAEETGHREQKNKEDLSDISDSVEPEKEKKEEVPSPYEALAEQLVHKQKCAQACYKQEHDLQCGFHRLLQETTGYLTEWQNILSENFISPSLQDYPQNLHEKLLALSDALNDWEKSLQSCGKALNDWVSSLHQPITSSRRVTLDSGDYPAMLSHYQAAEKLLTAGQSSYQALSQAVFTFLSTSHYPTVLTTPSLQRQVMPLAQTLVKLATDSASKQAHALQKSEQAYQSAQHRNEKAQDQLEIVRKKLIRKQVEAMANTLNHQPLLDFLAGKGRKYINEKDVQGRTALHCAVAQNQPDVVQWLLDHGADVEAQDADECTPLHWAAQRGYSDVAAMLLVHDAAIEAQDAGGFTPLHCAADKGQTVTAKLLITHDADVESKNSWQETPLHRAALQGHTDTVELLLEFRAYAESRDIDKHTPLYCAVQHGHMATAALMLRRGASTTIECTEGLTLLHLVAQLNYPDAIKLLLQHQSDINAQDSIGFTPLHWAAQEGHGYVVERLLDLGAAAEIGDRSGSTPLHCAAQQGHAAIVKFLLLRGLAMNIRDHAGCTPLHRAIQKEQASIVELLLSYDFDKVNREVQDQRGCTPMHWAVQQNHPVITELFLMRGASINTKNDDGKTPWDLAVAKGHQLINPRRKRLQDATRDMAQLLQHEPLLKYLARQGPWYINEQDSHGKPALWYAVQRNEIDIASWLLDHGADISIKDILGFTFALLHQAVDCGHTGIVKLLLARGAAIEVQDRWGYTPLHRAVLKGHKAIVDLLLKAGANVESRDENGLTPLNIARCNTNNADITTLLLNAGAHDTTDLGYKTTTLTDSCTHLHRAAFQGHAHTVKCLSDHDKDIEAKDKNQRTPLHFAVQQGHTDVVELLLTRGADREARDQYGFTPFYYAVSSGYIGILKVLAYHVVDIPDACMLLRVAKGKGHTDTVKLLLKKGAKVDVKHDVKYTASHELMQQDHKDAVIMPLQPDANRTSEHFDNDKSAVDKHRTGNLPPLPHARSSVSSFGGIPNVDNTCYLNATLQIIARLYPDLIDHQRNCLEKDGQTIVNKLTSNEQEELVTEQEAKAFCHGFINSYNKGKSDMEQLRHGEQEDTVPVLSFLLQKGKIQEIEFYATKNPVDADIYTPTIADSPSSGQFITINLPLTEPEASMSSLVESTLRGNLVEDAVWEGGSQVTRGRAEVGTKLSIQNLRGLTNDILPICAHRFGQISNQNSSTASKIEIPIKDPFKLTIAAAYLIREASYTGSLVGFIYHDGSLNSGHYMAYIKNKAGKWIKYNDAIVTELSEEPLEEAQKAYLYFYQTNSKDELAHAAQQASRVPEQSAAIPSQQRLKDAPEPVQARAALDAAHAMYKKSQDSIEAAARTLQATQAALERARRQSQESLLYLQTTQQYVTHLINAPPAQCKVAFRLQSITDDAQDHLKKLADHTASATQQQQGNKLLAKLYAWRQKEQQYHRHVEQLFFCDTTLDKAVQVQLLGEILPQYRYHIDILSDLIGQLGQKGHIIESPVPPPSSSSPAHEPKAVAHETDPLPTALQRIEQLGTILSESLQSSFQDNIAPILKEKLIEAPAALQEKVFHYFQEQCAFYPQVLRQYPVEAWVRKSLFHDLAQAAYPSEEAHERFRLLTAKLEVQYSVDDLTAVLWALQDKKVARILSPDELCDVMDMLPEAGTDAEVLLRLPPDQWRAALKTSWLLGAIQGCYPHLARDQGQHLIQELSHLAWDLQATQTLLQQLPQDYNPEELSRLLAFAAQHSIDDDQLLEVLVTQASSPDHLIAHWHYQLACSQLQGKLPQLLPQEMQESTYALIEELWMHVPAYQSINAFLEHLLLNQLQEEGPGLDPEHLHLVLSMMRDYRLDDTTYTKLLQQLTHLPSHQWSQHFSTQILQYCFAEEARERTVREIIAYMADHAPDVAYLQAREALEQAHQDILDTYQGNACIESNGNPIASWEATNITKWAQTVKNYSQNPGTGSLPTQSELIAVVMRAVELYHGYSPRNTQLLSLLTLLNANPDQGRLLQKNTGEGKSLDVAMFSAIKALLNVGGKSDVATTSTELSIREVKNQRAFFEMLALSVSENSNKGTQDSNKKKKQQDYQQSIVYGIQQDFQGDILREEFFGHELRMQRPYDCVVVDEVDNMLFDSRGHSTRLSIAIPATNHLGVLLAATWQQVTYWAKHLIDDKRNNKIYCIEEDFHKDEHGNITILSGEERDPQKCMFLIEGTGEDFIREQAQSYLLLLLRDLETDDEKAAYAANKKLELKIALLHIDLANENDPDQYKAMADRLEQLEEDQKELPWNADKQKYPPIVIVPMHLKEFAKQQVPRWIKSAMMALVYKKGCQYVVRNGGIVPVDYDSTGVLQHNMVLSNGLMQFLQMKEGLKVSPESISTNFISTVCFFKRYARKECSENHIYGLTGTLGNEVTKEFFKKVYNTDLVIVPPYKQRFIAGNEGALYACKELTPKIIVGNDINKWHAAIEASALQHAQQNRAVLIICRFIRQAHDLEERLSQHYSRSKIFSYTGKNRFTKEKVYPGEIVIATNIAGRGTDLTPDDVVEQHGGLHVCITFLPQSYRVELQNAGRTARKGNKGTAQLILHQPEAITIEELRQQRDKREVEGLHKAIEEVERMTFKDELFQRFCQVENKLIPTLDGIARMSQSQRLEEIWEAHESASELSACIAKRYENHIDHLVQTQIAAIPTTQWHSLSDAEQKTRKATLTQTVRTEEPYLEFQQKYILRERKKAVQEHQKSLASEGLMFHRDVVKAFEEGRQYVPEGGELAARHSWGIYERKAVEERFGLWCCKYMPQEGEPIDYDKIRAAFEEFLQKIEKDAKANNLIHNAFFHVKKGNMLYGSRAIAAYDKAIAFDPDFSLYARYNKAMVLLAPEENKHDHGAAKKELLEAKLLVKQYQDSQLTFQSILSFVQPPKLHTAQHLQHHLDILFQQDKHIDAAIGVITTAQNARKGKGNHVKLTTQVVDALFEQDSPQERHEKALAEVHENGLTDFFTIEEIEPKPWLSICAVALIGVAQIIAASVATVATCGLVTAQLLWSGISDVITAISSAISGKFSWKDWAISKGISVGISIVSAGISHVWSILKGGAQKFGNSLKEGAQKLMSNVVDTRAAFIEQVKEIAIEIGQGVGKECFDMLLIQGVQEIAGEALKEKITNQVSQAIMASMLKSTFIGRAMANDIAKGRDYWVQIFVREGLDMLNEKDSAWHTILQGIIKGSALQKLIDHIQKSHQQGSSKADILAKLASVGLPMLFGFLTDIDGFTDIFLKKFHARLERKYEQELTKMEAQTKKATEQQSKSKVEEQEDMEEIYVAEAQELMHVIEAKPDFDDDELPLNDLHDGQAFSTQTKVTVQSAAIDPKSSQEDRARSLGHALTSNVSARLLGKVNQHVISPLTRLAAGEVMNFATSSITKHLRERRESAVIQAQFGIFSDDHVTQHTENQAFNQGNITSNTSNTVPQNPEANNSSPGVDADRDVPSDEKPSYREGNVTDIAALAINSGMAIKIFKDGKSKGYIGTKNKHNGVIELVYITNPNPTDGNHGHYVSKVNGKIVDTSGDHNGRCLHNAVFAGMTEEARQKCGVTSGEDLYNKTKSHLLAHPAYAQQADRHYQTLLYRDPEALMRGAGVWADAATGLPGIENWLNDHPELKSLMDNTGSLVKVGGKQKKEAPLFGASVLPTAAHVPAARAQEDEDDNVEEVYTDYPAMHSASANAQGEVSSTTTGSNTQQQRSGAVVSRGFVLDSEVKLQPHEVRVPFAAPAGFQAFPADKSHPSAQDTREQGKTQSMLQSIAAYRKVCTANTTFQSQRSALTKLEEQLKSDTTNETLPRRYKEQEAEFQQHPLYQQGCDLAKAAQKLREAESAKADRIILSKAEMRVSVDRAKLKQREQHRQAATGIREELLQPVREILKRPSTPPRLRRAGLFAKGVGESVVDTAKGIINLPIVAGKLIGGAAHSLATWEDKLGIGDKLTNASEVVKVFFEEQKYEWENPKEYQARFEAAQAYRADLNCAERALNAEAYYNNEDRELGYWSSEALQAVLGAEVIKGGATLVKGGVKAAKASNFGAEVIKGGASLVKGGVKATQASKKVAQGKVAKTELVSVGPQFSGHAIERMAERGVTPKMVHITIKKGLKFYDPKNKSINFILAKKMGSGKDLLVSVDPLTRKVITVIVNHKLQKKRLRSIP
jgi:ankyrin repeat protein